MVHPFIPEEVAQWDDTRRSEYLNRNHWYPLINGEPIDKSNRKVFTWDQSGNLVTRESMKFSIINDEGSEIELTE